MREKNDIQKIKWYFSQKITTLYFFKFTQYNGRVNDLFKAQYPVNKLQAIHFENCKWDL